MKLRNHLEFIANRSSNDEERIARMKDLLIDRDTYSRDERQQIGHVLARIIEEQEEDVVLRQHAGNEIGYYWDTPSPGLRDRFNDLSEDEDLRYNLQSSFENDFPIEALRSTKPEQGTKSIQQCFPHLLVIHRCKRQIQTSQCRPDKAGRTSRWR